MLPKILYIFFNDYNLPRFGVCVILVWAVIILSGNHHTSYFNHTDAPIGPTMTAHAKDQGYENH